MKKNLLFLLILSTLFVGFSSCSEDDNEVSVLPEISITNTDNVTSVAQGDTIYFKANIKSNSNYETYWFLDGKQVSTDSVYKFQREELGEYSIGLMCINASGKQSVTEKVSIYGKFRDGIFILNEGNMTSENGSLIFISPKGAVTADAYKSVNKSELGNTAQNLFIANGKMYIISQNGKKNAVGNSFESDGMLIVANAETLKKEAAFNDELSVLSWPTHVAVLGSDNTFIRDNKGIYNFNTTTKELKFINGTNGALKNHMAVTKNKVFVPASKSVLVLEAGKEGVSQKIEFDAAVSGVLKSSDGNIWVSTTGTPAKIMKINAENYSIIKTNEISEAKVGAGWGATPGISAKGDTLYFSNASTKIYRHIFTTGATEFMVDAKSMVENAGMVYNNLAVHPKTGEVYLNTIKGYGLDYLINNISVFNFEGTEAKLSTNYKDYTHFPAGIYFTDNFK